MNQQESLISTTVKAARKLGIYMRLDQIEGNYRGDWYDPATDITIIGETRQRPMDAIEAACNSLTEYLAIPPNETTKQSSDHNNPGGASGEDGW